MRHTGCAVVVTFLLCECAYVLNTNICVEGPAVLNLVFLVVWDVTLCSEEVRWRTGHEGPDGE